MNLPLSVYDFLGYLASGFLILAAFEFGFDGNWLIDRDWKPGAVVLYVTIAYVVGHVLANLSSHFVEHQFARRALGPSEDILLQGEKKKGERTLWHWLFPGFFRPLPPETRERVLNTAKAEGLNGPGRALYLHAFAVVKQDKATLDRLNMFINLYGFCRNISFALLLAVLIIAAGGVWYRYQLGLKEPNWNKVLIASACAFGSIGMLYRYLKFYRHYTQEVLISYPEIKQGKGPAKPRE